MKTHTDSEALAAVLAEMAGNTQNTQDEHPEWDLLLAYHSQELPMDTEKSVRDHLVGCPPCTRTLLDLESFLAAGSEPSGDVADLAAIAAWRSFKARIDEQNQGGNRPILRRRSRRALQGLAASLGIGVLGLSLWVAQLRGSNASLQTTVAQLSAIRLNPPTLYVEEVTRAEESGLVVDLSAQQQFYQVVVIPDLMANLTTYQVELSDATGRTIFDEVSELSEEEDLKMILNRYQTPLGEYQIRVYAVVDGERGELIHDERLTVRER